MLISVSCVTVRVSIGNETFVAPKGIRTEAGIETAGFAFSKLTACPPESAGAVMVTVPVVVRPPKIVLDWSVNEYRPIFAQLVIVIETTADVVERLSSSVATAFRLYP